ncbi:MAG TPA: VWA domain-containing protein [Terriglobales bacterium]|nr:VWA domain-containing protein [Terriglobales bacterium]
MAQPTRRFRSRCKILLGCAISGLVLAARTLAQTSVEDVHVKPLSGITANQSSQKSALTSAVRSFKTRADLVIVPVSVTDAANRPVLGLEKENFQVYENKRPQTVLSYSTEDAPVSIGIVLDESGSMQNKLGKAREAINNLVSTANPDDEFFLITFSDKPVQILDFDSSAEQIKNELLYTVAKGSTALFDAVYLAIRKMEKANFSRKAILIVSDGEDNHSHYTENEIRNVAREADILIYGIGIFDAFVDPFDGQVGPEVLAQLSALTGGRTFVIQNPKDLVDAADRIGFELRNLYILSYTPQETSRDGKWHKIKVKLTLPKGLPALRVHAREGYYATAE